MDGVENDAGMSEVSGVENLSVFFFTKWVLFDVS